MTFQHRLNRDYELLPDTTETWVTLTFIRLMIRRLASGLTARPARTQPGSCMTPFQTTSNITFCTAQLRQVDQSKKPVA